MSNAKKTVKQAVSAAQSPVSIPVQDLKDRFKPRSIPLDTDFAAIIDVADCGRKAVGLSPDFPAPVKETGLTLDGITGQLKVLPEPDKGISLSDSGVGVKVAADKGIQVDASGIAVKPDTARGVTVDASGVGVKVAAGKGIQVDASGIAVKPDTSRGVKVDAGGIGVNHDATLQIVSAGQLGVTQNYVTRSGDSTITGGGSLSAVIINGCRFTEAAVLLKSLAVICSGIKGRIMRSHKFVIATAAMRVILQQKAMSIIMSIILLINMLIAMVRQDIQKVAYLLLN